MRSRQLLLLAVCASCVLGSSGALQRVCYLLGYNGNPTLQLIAPDQMQWHLCTHVIFAFADILNGTIHTEPPLAKYIEQMHQPNRTDLRLMVSVGGPSFDFVKSDASISRFIDSVLAFLAKYDLDGIDIDWEFPYETNDKKNFSKLLKMLRARFDVEGKKAGKRYLLSVALTPIMYIADKSYQVAAISKYVDFASLMTYDFHTPGTFPYTNHNAPLYSSKLDIFYFQYFNVFFSVHYMHSLGLKKEQIMVGIPFYGYLYYLANPRFHEVYSLSNGTQVSIAFNEVCVEVQSPLSSRVFDQESKVPYLYHGNRWISYDDKESVLVKAQWIVDSGFGGSMTFALNYDDYRAKCSSEAFPLQAAIHDILA